MSVYRCLRRWLKGWEGEDRYCLHLYLKLQANSLKDWNIWCVNSVISVGEKLRPLLRISMSSNEMTVVRLCIVRLGVCCLNTSPMTQKMRCFAWLHGCCLRFICAWWVAFSWSFAFSFMFSLLM